MSLPVHILAGYTRFRSGKYAEESDCYRSQGEGAQRPKMMIVACCDSRAAPETIFDAGLGEIFVVRNVANLVPSYAPDGKHHSTSAAIEFAVLSLGVKDIIVMGHGRCGGIRAVVEGREPLSKGDFIGKWMSDVEDVVHAVRDVHEDHATLCTAVERASVEHSLANLRTFPWLRMRENKGEIGLHGAWFDISLGELHVYEDTLHQWTMISSVPT